MPQLPLPGGKPLSDGPLSGARFGNVPGGDSVTYLRIRVGLEIWGFSWELFVSSFTLPISFKAHY